MLNQSQMSKEFWDEAALNVAYTRNMSPTAAKDKTPFEIWFNQKPRTSHLKVFGSTCFTYVAKPTKKLDDRSLKCTFLGYSLTSKAYRLLDESGRIILAAFEDVVFRAQPDKNDEPQEPSHHPYAIIDTVKLANDDVELSDSEMNSESSVYFSDNESDDSDEPKVKAEPAVESVQPETRPKYILEPIENKPVKDILAPPAHPKRIRFPIDYSNAFSAKLAESSINELQTATIEENLNALNVQWYKTTPVSYSATVPVKYEDIEKSVNSDEWYEAANSEIAALIEHDTWELVPLPSDRKSIKCKWVFRIKRDGNGNISRYKARLCACGYSQIQGLDYKDIYSPVVRTESLRIFLSIVAARDMEMHQMDVVSAFLNGDLEESIYMKQPPGFIDKSCPNHVCRLKKNLYGLKQAPRVWHKTIDPFLKSLQFKSLDADPCIYARWEDGVLSLISLYVDDLGIASDQLDTLLCIKEALNSKFKMTDEGELTFILGMTIRRNRDTKEIFISNELKIKDILIDYNMATCAPVSTPIEALTVSLKDCPEPNSKEWNQMQLVPYRECVGSLTYIMRTTRPDIAFAVGVANRFLHNPGQRHWNLVKRILRYLKGTLDFELKLSPSDFSLSASACDRTTSIEGPLRLSGYTDADWGGNLDNSKSTSGYSFFLGSSLVSWASKAQTTTATSSTYAEYIAAYHATCEALWSRSFLASINLFKLSESTQLFCDNDPSIKIAQFHMVTPRSKHSLRFKPVITGEVQHRMSKLKDKP